MGNNINTQILDRFEDLGISKELAAVYLELFSKGTLTVVQLSKQLSMGRNKVYRLLKELAQFNLVNKIDVTSGSTYEALHFDNLKLIVDHKKDDYEKASSGFNDLIMDLPFLQNANSVSSNVIHYYGIDGLKQVNWNLVHAEDMYRVYEVSRLSDYLDEKFAEDLRMEWLRRGIHTRDITNDNEIEGHTNISEFTKKLSEYRYLDPKVLKINTEIYIYNDIVTLIQYDAIEYNPSSIFCVEIRNAALAEFQKQLYDIIWNQAEELVIVDPKGKRIRKSKCDTKES